MVNSARNYVGRTFIALLLLLLSSGVLITVGLAQAAPPVTEDLRIASADIPRDAHLSTPPYAEIEAAVDEHSAALPSRPESILHDQFNDFSLGNVSSQNFEPSYDAYDAQSADDFAVPSGERWIIEQVDVAGVYRGQGQAASVNVFFYDDNNTYPGAAVMTQTEIVPISGLETGSFEIPLDRQITLDPGLYWVSVQANMDIDPDGQWFWRNRRLGNFSLAAWRNPGAGFQRFKCLANWGHRAEECFISDDADDQVFRLIGTAIGTPTPTVTGTPPTSTPSPTDDPSATSTSTLPPTSTRLPSATGTHFVPPPVVTHVAQFTPTTPTPAASPSPTAPCGPAWRGVPSPNGGIGNALQGISAVSANDIWAVGFSTAGGGQNSPLTMHWNGSEWTTVPTPNVGSLGSVLFSVTAIASNEVWAVGHSTVSNNFYRTLIMRWDGVQWNLVPSPNVGSFSNFLRSVDAASSQDIWAVGTYNTDSAGRSATLTMHWNGTAWSVVNSPSPGSLNNELRSVTTISANDAWAVGTYYSGFLGFVTLAMHWDGAAWTTLPTINPGEDDSFNGVTATGPNDVWAVGFTYDGSEVATLVERWNGSNWTRVPSPNVGSGEQANYLVAVDAISPTDIWAVGNYNEVNNGPYRTLTQHWDGTSWTIVSSHNANFNYNFLHAVDAVTSGDVWAAGEAQGESGSMTLTQRYNDPCVTPSPTSTPTETPTSTHTASATSTPILTSTPTNTTMPSPTICPVQFSDVNPGNAFYASIRCLACRGIISGYADSTFRPNVQVTRGQLAKIVSNSAGFSEDPGAQIFEDVPSINTFYQWINRLTRRGHMTGYACGGPQEPCTTGRPYFRPFANATRGQTSKIVSNAAGFTEAPIGQTFEDVAVSYTFFEFIQRLASRNVMQGYPCGGVGEPCLTGRPYFRPGNDVTRGQSARIVANTFFPGCNTP